MSHPEASSAILTFLRAATDYYSARSVLNLLTAYCQFSAKGGTAVSIKRGSPKDAPFVAALEQKILETLRESGIEDFTDLQSCDGEKPPVSLVNQRVKTREAEDILYERGYKLVDLMANIQLLTPV